jgi:hypothetical protein
MNANIPQAVGLSDDDTSDLVRKYYWFFHLLNPAQQDVMRRCMPSFDQAATAVGQGTTADDIHQFVASRLGGGAALGFPLPAEAAAQGFPVPARPSTAQGFPVPTANAAAGFPIATTKSK